MKCAKCGAELKVGCIYCSVCGQEAQIVPDYNILEDDYLRALLEEENKPKALKKQQEEKVVKKKKKKWPWIVFFSILILITIAAVIGVFSYRKHMNENSYDYQVQLAESELTDRNYENALSYYKKALNLEEKDIKVRLAMANIYIEQKDYESAMVLLNEVIQLDGDNVNAYKLMIQIYEKNEEYDNILALKENANSEEVLKLFAAYTVEMPEFSYKAGKYEEYITVELSAGIDCEIYYTTDGSDPIEDGKLYDASEPIELNEIKEYTICAVSCNEKGIYSEVAEMVYDIAPQAPEVPVVTPDGGELDTENPMITIDVPEGCVAYYTFDNTTPTTTSTKYETPFEAPAGKNILRVILVDEKTGLQSDEYSRQFTYRP